MLIKSVIKARGRRLIVVILRLIKKTGVNVICGLRLTCYMPSIYSQTETVLICEGPKKISYEQKQTHFIIQFSFNIRTSCHITGSIYG